MAIINGRSMWMDSIWLAKNRWTFSGAAREAHATLVYRMAGRLLGEPYPTTGRTDVVLYS